MNTEVKDMLNNAYTESLNRTRQFLETYYSKDLVNEAINFVIDRAKYSDDRGVVDEASYIAMMRYIQKVLEGSEKYDADTFEMYKEMFESFDKHRKADDLAFTFAKAATYVRDNPYKTLRPEVTSEYRKNKDFAVVFYYGDNDFGGYLENAAAQYCDEYNRLLAQLDIYSKLDNDGGMQDYYIKDLEFMERPDVIKETMKSLFIGAYMDMAADRIRLGNKEEKTPLMTDRISKAVDYIDYLDFNDDERWWIGKKEIFETVKKEFEGMQYDEIVNEPFEKYWLNGEVLIMFMEDHELKYMVK